MTTNKELPENAEVVDTDDLQMDSADFRNQSGAAIDNDDEDAADEYVEEDLNGEPLDEDGDPTGEHDHQQNDNYALGGHVTRSSGV